MMRPIAIILLIMGGGSLISGLVLNQRNRECQAARAARAADAEQICERATWHSSGHGGYYGSGWHYTRSWLGQGTSGAIADALRSRTASPSATGTVSRGGFGRSGGFFSFGG